MKHIQSTPNRLGIGPSVEDQNAYGELLTRLSDDRAESLSFNPRLNAIYAAESIDRRRVGSAALDKDTVADDDTWLRHGQQRYIAGMLGFVVSDTVIHSNDTKGVMWANVARPNPADLPPLPVYQVEAGTFAAANNGEAITRSEADVLWSAHLLAQHRTVTEAPDAMQRLFQWVVKSADTGNVVVPDGVVDQYAVAALSRQIGGVLGYEMGEMQVEGDGLAVPVLGINKHFDYEYDPYRS